jgi:hypothetical protein
LPTLIFAWTACPAIFAITTDTFIVLTANSWRSWPAGGLYIFRAGRHGATRFEY